MMLGAAFAAPRSMSSMVISPETRTNGQVAIGGNPRTSALAGAAAATTMAAAMAAAAAGKVAKRQQIGGRRVVLQAAAVVPEPVPQSVKKPGPGSIKMKTPEEPPPFDPAAQVGVTEPIGYFDPLNFCPPGNEIKFRKLRASEIKHGRVAMMASIGLLAQHDIRFQVFDIFDDVPNGVGAIATIGGSFGAAALFLVCLLLEFLFWRENPNLEPGNYGDPFGVNMYDTEMRNREINNGRFAMICVVGIIAADLNTGLDAWEQIFGVSEV